MSKRPIFALGCARSGTTMLRRILNSHSQIACPPETGFMMQLCNVFDIDRSKIGLNDMGFSDVEILLQMRTLAESFYNGYRLKQGKPRWADKSGYLPVIKTIDQIFDEEPFYIGIVRHGLDVSYSICELDWQTRLGSIDPFYKKLGDRHLAAGEYWCDRNRMLLDLRDAVGDRIHLISYEKLTSSPKTVLPLLFSFLGETYEEEVINFNKIEHDQGYEDHKIQDQPGIIPNSKRYEAWPDSVIEKILPQIRPMLRELNYDDLL